MRQICGLILALCASAIWAVEPLCGKFTVNDQGKQVQFANENIGPYSWDDAITNIPTGWRMLTYEEWQYLLREEVIGYGPMNAGFAIVNTVKGLMIVPDNWTTPAGYSFTPGVTTWNNNSNSYTNDECAWLETQGAVFLPANGETGCYWSSTPNGDDYAYSMYFGENALEVWSKKEKTNTYSVRLVKDVEKGNPTGVESQKTKVESYKILRDGQLLIVRDDKMYTILGQEK